MREASLGRLRPLLPNEPCLHLPAAERALSERHLLPVLAELEAQQDAAEAARDAAKQALREERKQERHEKWDERVAALKAKFTK